MNRKNFFTALTCGLLIFSMLGCGVTNHLQSITLSVSNTSPNDGNAFNIKPGLPVPMYAWGIYSDGKQKLLFGTGLKFQILSTPFGFPETGQFGDPNGNPPLTVQLSADGQLTPVTPFPACSYVDVAAPPATTPAFQTTGWYIVTATYGGMTSPQGAVYMQTAGLPATTTNPTGQCGPS